MSNHVHFIAKPKDQDGLARLFNTVHMRYSQYINRQRKATGHLWQGRFYSCLLDDKHLYRAIRYIENNPVRAEIVKKAWDYQWSSCKDHIDARDKSLIKISQYKTIKQEDWKNYLKESDPQMNDEMELKTQRGLVIGTEQFINKLEEELNRSLKCLSPGRPKKEKRG